MPNEIKATIAGVVIAILTGLSFMLFHNVDSKEIVVIQDVVDGELHVYTTPGVVIQKFGTVTTYPLRKQYTFDMENPKRLRFNDGGHANLMGSVSWEMPLDPAAVIKVHRAFGSANGVEDQAVAKMLDSAIYFSGPLMSSTESSGERRGELVQYINDQAINGVYATKVISKIEKDPLTGGERQVSKTEIIIDDSTHSPKRQQDSMLGEFGIKLQPMAISEIKYDDVVENQIKQRQDAITKVQLAVANAKRAEQDAITAEKEGEANAAKAKWAQEVIKATKVTEAQQQLEVATLNAKAAEQYKREQILRGEGEGEYKRLIMNADGALDKKLDALIKMNAAQWEAISKHPGPWVPSVVMGGDKNTSSAAQQMIDMLSVKTAKDLSIDMEMRQGRK